MIKETIDQLSQEQQESVLKYMEAVDSENFQQCLEKIKQHNFVPQQALNATFNEQEDDIKSFKKKNQAKNISVFINQQENSQFDEIYGQPSEQRGCLLSMLHNINKCKCLSRFKRLSRQFYHKIRWKSTQMVTFEKLYGLKLCREHSVHYIYQIETLQYKVNDQIINNSNNIKPIMLIISKQQINLKIKNLLNSSLHHFEIVGVTQAEILHQLHVKHNKTSLDFLYQALKQNRPHLQTSALLVYHKQFSGLVEIIYCQMDVQGLSASTVHSIISYFRKAVNIYQTMMNFSNNSNEQFSNLDQDEDSFQIIDKSKEKALLKQQNDLYWEIEQKQRQKRQFQLLQTERMNQIQEQRAIRKYSIPDEPISSENTITCKFRCPDGTKLLRTFPKNEQIELLYNWVEVNNQIHFEDQINRKFNLFISYPPASLSNLKQCQLQKVFDEPIMNIIIQQI